MKNLDLLELSRKMEKSFEWEKWIELIPPLNFLPKWKVTILPPLAGAIVRFKIEHNNNWVSVYLDCYGILAGMDKPYWEIYSKNEAEIERFYMLQTDELMKAIKKSLSK